MAREYNNGIETEENKARFKKFCEIHKVPDSFENWIWWKDNIRDAKIS